MRFILIIILICFLSGCSHSGNMADTYVLEDAGRGAASGESQREMVPPENAEANQEPDHFDDTREWAPAREDESAASENAGSLSSADDIHLHAVDETGRNYIFLYNHEEFSAQYTKDNWKIVDSYRIINIDDMTIICQALLDLHPVHGRDMISIRTAEDMAFEWLQHNLAYEFLPEDSPWRENAKDVDLDPADQGRTVQEIYEDRTGKEFRIEDIIG